MTSRKPLGLLIPAALLVLSGCLNDVAGTDGGPLDTTCIECNDAGPDAGVDAGNLGDGGEYDAGPIDAGPIDAGPIDAGAIDAGPVDAGPVDAGPEDAGPVDAGPVDAGPEDAGPVDAGPIDAGPQGDGGPWIALSVSGNPVNVLSAVGSVTADPAVVSVHVDFATLVDAGPATSTPEFAMRSGAVIVPVLPLRAQTSYSFTAVGALSDGGTLSSAPATLTTNALPLALHAFTVTTDGGPIEPGYTLIARLPQVASGSVNYVSIVDASGAPVWYLGLNPGLVGDFQKQPDGTYTIAVDDVAHAVSGLPEAVATFAQYDVLGNQVATWATQGTIATDCHEFLLQPDGTALMLGLVEQTVDMSAYAANGNPSATVIENVVQRVAPDGGVLFSWNTFDDLSIDAMDHTVPRTGSVIDATHANSIAVLADGNYLVSLRNMSQLVKVNATTGDVMWKLGGQYSDGGAAGDFNFVNDPLGGFSLQHAARELPNGDIILFDDGNGHVPPQSRAVEYMLDTTSSPMTATLVWSAEDSPPLYAYALGYAQRLGNGDTLITYGTTSHVQEVDTNGNVLWDLFDLTHPFGIYRAFRVGSLY
ncbi:MAG: aryl-sulfate sulfotransferase [Deltaproteobacteria bacterium]|nr:aryl-sulfate sulfotransferase [Deltaproteobacteria bacterium]